MENLKTPKGTVKKGMAQFGRSTNLTLSVAIGGAIQFGETTFFNDSSNIVLLSTTQIKLLAGKKYKIYGDMATFTVGDSVTQFYNVTNGVYVGNKSVQLPPINTYNAQIYTKAIAILNPSIDTIIEIRNVSAQTLETIASNSIVVIEELETYLIPTDPTKYTETINFTSATGSVVIPSGLPVGTKKLIRKVNATQGTVTISCTGETFTSSALSSITLNADGDFWLVEKVTATRWDLIEGKESGSNSNGSYIRHADSTQDIKTTEITYAVGTLSFTLPIAVLAGSIIGGAGVYGTPYNNMNVLYGFGAIYLVSTTVVRTYASVAGGSNMVGIVFKCKWY